MDTESYRREIALLREENEYLRAAAYAFGELAERLANELRQLRAQRDTRALEPSRSRRAPVRLNS